MTEINFPVYKLDKLKPAEENGVIYYLKNDSIYIIDDKSIPKPTLGGRRLQLQAQNFEQKQFNIYKLKQAIFFLGDFVKLAISNQWFIDSLGNIFTYTKTRSVPLIFKRITKVIPLNTGGAILEIESMSTRYKCLHKPTDEKYAGLLQLSPREFILYGVYKELHKNTTRKI